jgi:glycosyltransferase involved in cell wall biosynthesis
VAHVVFDFQGGGMETLVADLARRFAGRASISVVSLSGRAGRMGSAVRPLLDQLEVIRPIPGISMLAPVGLVRRLRAIRPDVVHLHSGAWFKGALAARLAGVPTVIYTEHGREHHDPPGRRVLDRLAASMTDAVVAVSERLRTYLHAVIGVPESKLRTVANGVDLQAFSMNGDASELRASLGIPPTVPVIGSVGRFERVKGYADLVAAFVRLRATSDSPPSARLVLCGDGPERAALERQVHESGVGSAVHFTGWVERPAPYYRLFDIFALTSHSEGAPVSLMEAMASGALPVVTRVGANAEILGPPFAGHVVEPGDIGAITTTLRAVLHAPRNPDLRRLARRRIQGHYNLDRVAAEYERLYRNGGIGIRPDPAHAGDVAANPQHLYP